MEQGCDGGICCTYVLFPTVSSCCSIVPHGAGSHLFLDLCRVPRGAGSRSFGDLGDLDLDGRPDGPGGLPV